MMSVPCSWYRDSCSYGCAMLCSLTHPLSSPRRGAWMTLKSTLLLRAKVQQTPCPLVHTSNTPHCTHETKQR